VSIILNVDERRDSISQSIYSRLSSLGSKLNSRIPGGPLSTLISAFVQILSDAWEDLLGLLADYSPLTATGAAQKQVLGFFGFTPFEAKASRQRFAIFRSTAAIPFVVSTGATIQTQQLPSGKIYTYKLVGDGFTIPAGEYFVNADFECVQTGLATTLIGPQPMDIVSGFAGAYVSAGSYIGSLNPLATMNATFGQWVSGNAVNFEMDVTIQGRDAETDAEFFDRCVSRWSEQSTGSTAKAYESWIEGFVSADGSTPVLRARVTDNQIFDPSVSTWPSTQRPTTPAAAQEFIMGVEVAVALRSGLAPTPSFFQELGVYMLPLIPHTDKVWFRPPNMLAMGSGSVSITMKGGASYAAMAKEIARSFFVYDEALKNNYSGLGETIYKSDLIHAIRSLSPAILDVKVVFTPPSTANLDVDGNLALDYFDQVSMPSPDEAITVAVL